MREEMLSNDLPYSLIYTPPINPERIPTQQLKIDWDLDQTISLPKNRNDLAFYPVHHLSALIKEKKITSVELTQFFIDRLRKYGDIFKN
jgi:hypothetical protein